MKIIALTLCTLLLFSCCRDDDEEGCRKKPSYKDCYTSSEAADLSTLTVNVTINSLNPRVPIEVYRGSDVENGSLVVTDTLTTSSKRYYLSEGKYAGAAVYKIIFNGDERPATAKNYKKIRADKTEYCEGTCYEPGSADLDLTL